MKNKKRRRKKKTEVSKTGPKAEGKRKKQNVNNYFKKYKDNCKHGLRTPGEEISFTARPKIKSQSQIFRYGRSIFCLPHRPKISDFLDLCLHWVSVVRASKEQCNSKSEQFIGIERRLQLENLYKFKIENLQIFEMNRTIFFNSERSKMFLKKDVFSIF